MFNLENRLSNSPMTYENDQLYRFFSLERTKEHQLEYVYHFEIQAASLQLLSPTPIPFTDSNANRQSAFMILFTFSVIFQVNLYLLDRSSIKFDFINTELNNLCALLIRVKVTFVPFKKNSSHMWINCTIHGHGGRLNRSKAAAIPKGLDYRIISTKVMSSVISEI